MKEYNSYSECWEWRNSRGQHHRENGPAIEWHVRKNWYYHGEYIHCSSQEEFERLIKLQVFL